MGVQKYSYLINFKALPAFVGIDTMSKLQPVKRPNEVMKVIVLHVNVSKR